MGQWEHMDMDMDMGVSIIKQNQELGPHNK